MTDHEYNSSAALEAVGLGKRYRRHTALADCGFQLPAGRVCALVGPNGAGKSTLLTMAAGLLAPTQGRIEVFGSPAGDPRTTPSVALLAQDKPLFRQLSVDDHLRLGRELNPRWNRQAAEQMIGDVPRAARVETLSAGQRTKLALGLALGKQADLLLLDEPMADLDPLARHEASGAIMADAAERGTTVVISSHILAELEPLCDHLVMLDAGRVRLAGDTDELIAAHTVITAGADHDESPAELDLHTVLAARTTGRSITALIRPGALLPGDWIAAAPTLEELVLAYMRNPSIPPLLAEPYVSDAPVPDREAALR